MDIPSPLRKELVKFIRSIPNIQSNEVKKSFLLSACLDSSLLNQIEISYNTNVFTELLITTLHKYGTLEDGRDPITTILLEASDLLGFEYDGSKKGGGIVTKWKDFLKEGDTPQVVKISSERRYYLKNIIDEVSNLNLSIIFPEKNCEISVSNVYIDILTNIQLHLKLENLQLNLKLKDYKITDWWVNSSIQNNKDGNDVFEFSRAEPRGYDTQIIERIISKAQAYIKGDGNKISPLEEERPKIFRPFWDDGIKDNYYTLDSFDVAASAKRLILVGVPGSGKSTFTQYLTLFLAKQQLNEIGQFNKNHKWPHGASTPILIEIKKFVDQKNFPDVKKSITIKFFWNYVREEILGINAKFSDELFTDLISANGVIIFDGLDEAFAPKNVRQGKEKRIRQIFNFSKKLSTKFSECRIIFTTRIHEFSDVQNDFSMAGYKIVEMETLQSYQMLSLAKNIFSSVGFDNNIATQKARQLSDELVSVSDFLKQRPLFLTLMVMIFLDSKSNKIPTKKVALLHQSIILLIGRWTYNRIANDNSNQFSVDDSEVRQIYSSLEKIAFRAQNNQTNGKSLSAITIGDIYSEFSYYEYRTYEIVNYLTKQSGIFDFSGFDDDKIELYRFSHRVFQEFLSASYLMNLGDYCYIREKIEKDYLQWREPCILLGELFLKDRDVTAIWSLIETLAKNDISKDRFRNELKWHPIWLAAKLIIDNKDVIIGSTDENLVIVNALRDKIQRLLSIPKVMSARNRVDCGVALAYLGDNRQGVGLTSVGIPDIDWCLIPAGEFQMGLTKETSQELSELPWAIEWDCEDQMPSHTIYLPDYYISRYPITVKQFRVFLNSPDGYCNDEWWTKTGLRLRELLELSIKEKPILPDNFPQNYISWYEANAFCNWLSKKTGAYVKLPSEPEWEKSAKGTTNQLFPWGDDYDCEYCNVAETGIGGPCPVGCFPLPNGVFGDNTPLDLCGNVWEWCTTIFSIDPDHYFLYPYETKDGREKIEREDNWITVTRGGSFTNIPQLAQITFRGRDRPSFNPRRQGFRVVMHKST